MTGPRWLAIALIVIGGLLTAFWLFLALFGERRPSILFLGQGLAALPAGIYLGRGG
jgi:hypothetical protein